MLDPSAIRAQFPLFRQAIDDRPLVYLDSAATAPMPEAVLAAVDRWERTSRGNVHRGMHVLAERSTEAYERARASVARFLRADAGEIVFTNNCTASLNIAARGLGEAWGPGDAVVLSILEHHSNIVPWLQLKASRGIEVKWIGCDDGGALRMDDLDAALSKGNVKLVSVTAQSNVLGVRPDLRAIVAKAHAAGALVCADAAQAAPHMPLDVRATDIDLLAFSGHKLYGPMGIGVLYAKRPILDAMPPLLGGGGMIRDVRRDGFAPADAPQKFEAGTPNIVSAIGLAAGLDWLGQYRWEDIAAHEEHLLRTSMEKLSDIAAVTVLGKAPDHLSLTTDHSLVHGCFSFIVGGVHAHDLTAMLGEQGICLRAGHHCAQPLHDRLGIAASARVSIGIFNDTSDIDALAASLPGAIDRLRA